MKRSKNISKTKDGPIRAILFFLVAVTLYFNPSFQDPFNVPKFIIVILGGLWLSGYLLFNIKINSEPHIVFKAMIIFFLLTYFVSSIFSQNTYNAFLGESSRKNGFFLYLFFSVFLYSSAQHFDYKNIQKFFKVAIWLLSLLVFYGLLQSQGIDFAKWNNPYNSVILTMGNPNFASALLSILAVVVFSYTCTIYKFNIIRAFLFALLLSTLYVIYLNGSYQGLVSLIMSISIFFIILLVHKNKKMGLISLAVFLFASSLALLGTLQKGPLQDVLYKDSISVRGYYWRAALKMLQENLWFGVGPDNYGTYFRYYRDSGYPLKYGFDITSNNAHNVFLQFFATGGLFVGLSYLAIIIYIFLKCVANLKNLAGVDLINFAGLFSAWIAYLLQSLISIDNVGLAIWGWVLGGTLLGLTRRTELTIENSDRAVSIPESSNVKSIRQIFSVFMMIILILPLSFLIRGDTNMMVARSSYNPGLNIQNSALFVNIQNVLKIPFLDPYYKVILADILFRSGYTSDAKNTAQSLLKQYPDNVDIALALTYFNEATGDVLEAIKLRQEISRLDPWNAKNFLSMGQLYEYTKQTKEAQKSYLRIIQFAPNSELAKTAQEKLDKLVD